MQSQSETQKQTNTKKSISKFTNLNFNLKNEILSFLKIEETLSMIVTLNKRFIIALKKQKYFQMVEKESKKTLKEINFSSECLEKIKKSFISQQILEEESKIDELCSYYLKLKYKNDFQLDLSETRNIKTNILSEFINSKKNLKFIFLFDNKFGKNENDVKMLSLSLLENTNVNQVYISRNKIGRNLSDLVFISILFLLNNSIELFDFSYNKIGRNLEDVKFLSYGIRFNRGIKYLNLCGNKIDFNENESDFEILCDALMKNMSIEEVDLSFNKIKNTENNVDCIERLFETKKNLKFFSIVKNPIEKNQRIIDLSKKLNGKLVI